MTDSDKKMSKGKKVFVAMSGGVDSSVTAALMKEQGYDVTGVTMCFDLKKLKGQDSSACGVKGISDAQKVAKAIGISHYVLDFEKNINDYVIDDFINEYISGRTPNPCVRCNQFIKFGILYEKVMSLGAAVLATGHYARIHFDEESGHYEIRKAIDSNKDQSYFLYKIDRSLLSKIFFPLGNLLKEEVRELARNFGLPVAEKEESQDICFVPEQGYKDFIRERLGERVFEPGNFIDHKGEIVGQHKGVLNYTIGQRDKLGIALGVPVYVYKIDRETNTVYVGPEEFLDAKGLTANQFNPISLNIPIETMEVYARIRYNAREVKSFLTSLGDDKIRLEFAEPQKAVTPGQSVVLYRDDVLLGGGVIEQAI